MLSQARLQRVLKYEVATLVVYARAAKKIPGIFLILPQIYFKSLKFL